MDKNVFYTISSLNYLHYALTVRESFLKHNPNYDFIIFIADSISNKDILSYLEKEIEKGADIRFFKEVENELKDAPFNDMLTRYSILEFNTSIKPYCMKYLFKKGYKKVAYIDPDIKFYSSIEKLDKILDDMDVVLTPHTMEAYPDDDKLPNSLTIMQAGICNLGFIAVKNTENGNKLADFWMDNLKDKCYNNAPIGLFTDQKWSDWFPSLFDKVYILKDRGYNASYWNIHERIIENRDGVYFANDDKLVFYHFSGLNRNCMEAISKYQTRFELKDRKEDLKQLFVEYLDDVNSKNADVLSKCKYYFENIPNTDVKIRQINRRMFHRKLEAKKIDLFNPDLKTTKKKLGLYHSEIFLKRHKLKYGLLWLLDNFYLKTKKKNFGINIIGYINEIHSIGEVARATAKKLKASGIPFSIYDIKSGACQISSDEQKEFSQYIAKKPPYDVNLFIINADSIPSIYKNHKNLFDGKYNIANWYWEFESGFDKFSNAFKYLDEVIVSTEHIKKGIQKAAPKGFKISKVPFAFNQPRFAPISKENICEKYGIDKNAFLVFFNFDYNSSYDRKNPEAILKAFNQALANENACLVLKTTNANNDNKNKQKFLQMVKELNLENKVVIIDEFLTKEAFMQLLQASGVYISLHRGEGLSMGCIEAMSLSKPVIASNYSGNLEFMNGENSLLVDVELKKPDTDFIPYKDVELWAEPNIEQAANYLRLLFENEEKRTELSHKAKSQIDEIFSNRNFQLKVYEILKRI